jgi:hypothetical protein
MQAISPGWTLIEHFVFTSMLTLGLVSLYLVAVFIA